MMNRAATALSQNDFQIQWIMIGDLSGPGVDSRLIMMMAEASIISIVNSMTGANPSEVIDSIKLVMRENICRLAQTIT